MPMKQAAGATTPVIKADRQDAFDIYDDVYTVMYLCLLERGQALAVTMSACIVSTAREGAKSNTPWNFGERTMYLIHLVVA